MVKGKRLGRGLDALLGGTSSVTTKTVEENTAKENLKNIPVEFLQRGQYQPRRVMTEDALQELANSIKAQGVIQPIVVRTISSNKYEIVAGERRWRASQLAGLSEVPCIIKEVPDEAAIAMALIENIQRENLNAIEEALALQRLMSEFKLTHQEAAEAVGKSRTTVTNLLRLLSLSEQCKELLERGDLEMGHARALLALENIQQNEAARTVVAKGLTVRETERLVKKLINPQAEVSVNNKQPSADIKRLEQKITEKIGAKVSVQDNKGKGKLVINYSNLDQLEGILAHWGLAEE